MAIILLIRHGEADGNTEGRFIGQQDVPLTDLGRVQALALAGRLESLPVSRIVSSDLARCLDTMRPTALALGMEISGDARLREISNGEWGGLLPSEIEARWPEMFLRYRAGEDVSRPGGETWRDVAQRVIAALEELAGDLSPDGVALVGTHAGPIGAAARWAAGLDHHSRGGFGPVANTSVTTLHFPGPILVGYNCHADLPGRPVGLDTRD